MATGGHTNDRDMVIAINRIIAMQGGLVIAENGKVLGELPLPIAGPDVKGKAKMLQRL